MVQITTFLTAALAGLATAAPATSDLTRRLNTGDLTWYTEGMGVNPTACGAVHQITEHIAALSAADYGTYANPNESPVCGKYIRIHGPNGNSVQAKVVDKCYGCAQGDVDVMPVVFLALGYTEAVGRVSGMTWEWV